MSEFDMRKFRRDTCAQCGGPLFILKWAKKKKRKCYGCVAANRAAKAAEKLK